MSDGSEILVRVTAPHFCASVILMRGAVVRAAPILRWALGWESAPLSAYFKKKGWEATQKRLPDPTFKTLVGRAIADNGFKKFVCNKCGGPPGGQSCETCLKAWNGTWPTHYWRTYMGEQRDG